MKNGLTLALTPTLSPRERENRLPRLGKLDASGCSVILSSNKKTAVIETVTSEFLRDVNTCPLSPGERVRVRARVNTNFHPRYRQPGGLIARALSVCSFGVLLFAVFFLPNYSRAAIETNSILAIPSTDSVSASPRYHIALCDWMILKRQKLGAFQLTKDIGADGVEVDMGSLGQRETFASALTNSVTREQFLNKARELNLEIASIAMSGFYAQSFAERTNVTRLVQDCLDTMQAMKVKVAFLPLGVTSDLLKHPELRSQVVERLRAAGKQAEAAGVVIGVETELDADEQIKLLDEVGSPAIKIYYNLANALQHQRDYAAELQRLGKNRVCQIHCSNQDAHWLQNDPQVSVPKLKAALDTMDWRGWLVIERSRDTNDVHNVKKNYGANAAYLKSVFQK